jgi:hypothetical protein
MGIFFLMFPLGMVRSTYHQAGETVTKRPKQENATNEQPQTKTTSIHQCSHCRGI